MNKAERQMQMIMRLVSLGVSFDDALALRKIERTLSRWSALECGDSNNFQSWAIERDEKTKKPYIVYYPHTGNSWCEAIPDRENGALRRLEKIMAQYPELIAYNQTDPRGCALYIIKKSDIAGLDISSNYSRGIAVCA